MSKIGLVSALLATLGACTQGPNSAAQWAEGASWSYAWNGMNAPSASYAVPNTDGGLDLECIPLEGVVLLVNSGADIAEDRAVEVRVADATYRTIERLDPPDGYAVSRITIPLRDPLLEKFGAGKGPMTIKAGDQVWTLPEGPEPKRMVRACIKLSFDR